MHADSSQDVVLFHYVLHHASDGDPISLLREARRVTRKYVIVGEDMAGEDPERALRNFFHETAGLFRGPEEWQQLFELLGFKVHRKVSARWDTMCPVDSAEPTSRANTSFDFFCRTEVQHMVWALEKVSNQEKVGSSV